MVLNEKFNNGSAEGYDPSRFHYDDIDRALSTPDLEHFAVPVDMLAGMDPTEAADLKRLWREQQDRDDVNHGYTGKFKRGYSAVENDEAEDRLKGKAGDKNAKLFEKMLEQSRKAAWDARKIYMGGVEMTNAEAQSLRRFLLDNPDYAQELARQNGATPAEAASMLVYMREMKELRTLERDGRLSPQQQSRLEELENSAMAELEGDVLGTAYNDTMLGQKMATDQIASTDGDRRDAVQTSDFGREFFDRDASTDIDPLDEPAFPSREPLKPAFEAAKAAGAPLDQPKEPGLLGPPRDRKTRWRTATRRNRLPAPFTGRPGGRPRLRPRARAPCPAP